MRPGKTSDDLQGLFKIGVCFIAAVLILLIAFPAFAADAINTEKGPEAEELLITEEITEEEKDEPEAVTETDEVGYITMRAVSENPSVTN